MRALAALVVTPLATVAFLHVATSVMGDPAPVITPAAIQPPASLVWADRVFTTKVEFRTWLARRDQSYARWVKKHPGASPWEPAAQRPDPALVQEAQRQEAQGQEAQGVGGRSTLLAVLLALLGVLTVLAFRARDSILGAVVAVRERLAVTAVPTLSPAGAAVGVGRLEVVQRRYRGRKQAVGEVRGRTFAEFEATVATMLQRPETEVVEVVEEPVVRLLPAPARVEPEPSLEPEPFAEPEPSPEPELFLDPEEEPALEAAPPPPPPPKIVSRRKPQEMEPAPPPTRAEPPPTRAAEPTPLEPTSQPEAAAPRTPVPPKKPRIARPRARRRTTKPPSPKTHAFCEITYSRGYIRGQFWARLWDVEGNPTVAKSELFSSRSELPQRSAEAEDALEGLAQQLADAGWEPYDDGLTWYGRWFVKPRVTGPPGLIDEEP